MALYIKETRVIREKSSDQMEQLDIQKVQNILQDKNIDTSEYTELMEETEKIKHETREELKNLISYIVSMKNGEVGESMQKLLDAFDVKAWNSRDTVSESLNSIKNTEEKSVENTEENNKPEDIVIQVDPVKPVESSPEITADLKNFNEKLGNYAQAKIDWEYLIISAKWETGLVTSNNIFVKMWSNSKEFVLKTNNIKNIVVTEKDEELFLKTKDTDKNIAKFSNKTY